jgi:Fe(3+) dicitrate transport protein
MKHGQGLRFAVLAALVGLLAFATPLVAAPGDADAAPPAKKSAPKTEKGATPKATEEKPPEEKGAAVKGAIDSYAPEGGARTYPRVGEIVVSAARGVPLTYPGGRDVIEKDELQEYPSANVQEVIRTVPGVYIIPEAGNDGRINIGMRGHDPRRSGQVTLLIDGIPSTEGPYGQQDQDALPITFERIARIDVIRGGASIRYGPNSAGGVVNFITEAIPLDPLFRLSARYGSHGDHSVWSSAGGTWEGLGVLVTGVVKGGDGFRDQSRYHIDDYAAKFDLAVGEHDVLAWSVARYLEDSQMPGGLSQADYDADPSQSTRFNGQLRADQYSYSLSWTHDVDARTSFSATAWYKSQDRTLADIRPILPPYSKDRIQNAWSTAGALEVRYACPLDFDWFTTDLFVSGRFLMEKVCNFYYRQPFGGPVDLPYELNVLGTTRSTALFVEDTMHLTDRLDFAVGGRLESLAMEGLNRDDGTTQSKGFDLALPEANVTWRVRPDTAIYGSFQESFGPPQYETAFEPGSTLYQRLKPEHANIFEVGARTRAVDGLHASLALYYVRYRNRLQYVNISGSGGIKQAYNTGREEHKGIEIGLDYDFGHAAEVLTGLSAYVNATWLDAEITNGEFDGNRSPDAPKRMANWGVRYEHPTGLWARIGGSYVTSAFKDAANTPVGSADGVAGPIPGYTIWDASLGWRQNPDGEGLSVSVGMTNLFDTAYYRRFVSGIYPGAPRQEFVTASWEYRF